MHAIIWGNNFTNDKGNNARYRLYNRLINIVKYSLKAYGLTLLNNLYIVLYLKSNAGIGDVFFPTYCLQHSLFS